MEKTLKMHIGAIISKYKCMLASTVLSLKVLFDLLICYYGINFHYIAHTSTLMLNVGSGICLVKILL